MYLEHFSSKSNDSVSYIIQLFIEELDTVLPYAVLKKLSFLISLLW